MKKLKIEAAINDNGEMAYEVNKSKTMNLFEVLGVLHNISSDINKMIEDKLKVQNP